MKQRFLLFFIICLSIINVSVSSALAQTELIEAIDKDGPRRYVLDNGLTVIVKEDHSSSLVAIHVLVGCGGATEGEYAGSGISHFVEHMLFKGTGTRGVGEIEKEIKAFGGIINGFTSHDYTGYQIVVPKAYFSAVLGILKDALFYCTINPKELEKERKVILKEIRLGRDEPTKYLSRLLWSTVFRHHPYRYPVIGYQDLFEKLTRADLLEFYKRMYVPNNIILSAVGDLDRKDMYEEVKNVFRDIKRSSLADIQRPRESEQLSKRVLEKIEDLKLAYFCLGFRSVGVFDEDLFPLDVLAIVLADGASSRLNQKLYREKELVYSIGAWNYTPKDPGIFIISGVAEPDKVYNALEAINGEIDKIKTQGISKEELVKAKNAVLASYVSLHQTVSGQASDLAASEFIAGDFDFSKRYVEGIESVKPEDIKEVSSEYFIEDGLSVVLLFPKSAQKEAAVAHKAGSSRYQIQRHELRNGIKLLLREDRRLPLVSIRVLFNGGLRTEQEANNGICNLAAAMLIKGTDSMTEQEISETVESLGGDINCISGNNSFGIDLNLLSRDLDAGLDLLKEIVFSSNCPPEILEREKKSVLAAIKSEQDDIYQFGMKLMKENLFKTHPYRFTIIGNMKSVERLDREDILNYYKNWRHPNNMVLSVFGDIEPQKVFAKLEEDLSGLKKGIMPSLDIPRENFPKTKKEVHQTLNKAQSVVMIGFPGTTIHNDDRFVLAVISSILSGRDGRLSMRLREKLGLSYALGSFSLPGVDPGYYLFYVGTNAENIPLVKKELLRQIQLLVRKYVPDEEIKLAKKSLMGRHIITLQTNSALAFRTSLDELYGLGYDDYLKFTGYIESVTREDILGVANKYFNPESYTMVVVEGRK